MDDPGSGGSSVTLSYDPPDSTDIGNVLVAGQPIRLLGTLTSIVSVSSAPASGRAVVVVADRLQAQSAVGETTLSYDFSPWVGTAEAGHLEAVGGNLVTNIATPGRTAGVGDGLDPRLVRVDPATGTPDTADQIGSLLEADGTSWYYPTAAVGGIAYLGNGEYCIAQNGIPVFSILQANGTLKGDQSSWQAPNGDTLMSSAAYFGTSGTANIGTRIRGMTTLGTSLYIIRDGGQLFRVGTPDLKSPRDGGSAPAFTPFGSLRFEYVPVTARGTIAGTAAIAGMWTTGSELRVLRRVGNAWAVYRVTDGSPPTATKLYDVATRPYDGATELGGRLYALSRRRIYRTSLAGDTSVEAGTAADALRVRLDATGVLLGASGRGPLRPVTYDFVELA